jgi:hypothetical protein
MQCKQREGAREEGRIDLKPPHCEAEHIRHSKVDHCTEGFMRDLLDPHYIVTGRLKPSVMLLKRTQYLC